MEPPGLTRHPVCGEGGRHHWPSRARETVHGATWSVLAADRPDLEPVLRARKEAVENDFLKEMREGTRLAIYRNLSQW